jgi:hypothetical protein
VSLMFCPERVRITRSCRKLNNKGLNVVPAPPPPCGVVRVDGSAKCTLFHVFTLQVILRHNMLNVTFSSLHIAGQGKITEP